jgi:transposase-like protein
MPERMGPFGGGCHLILGKWNSLTPRLYIFDGGEALHAAVRCHAGEAAFIQRCQVHKKRNVVDHLPEEHKPDVRTKLQNAYAMADYADARRALGRLHRELMDLNPSAARSLEEGMEETLTVHKLLVRTSSAGRCIPPTSSNPHSRLSRPIRPNLDKQVTFSSYVTFRVMEQFWTASEVSTGPATSLLHSLE